MIVKLSQKQLQKAILAPHMQRSIEVLLLPISELNKAIEQEIQDNPLLEIEEKKTLIDKTELEKLLDQNIKRIKDAPYSTSNYQDQNESNESDDENEKIPVAPNPPFEDYLLQQLRIETNDPIEFRIGEIIINELDEYGYFKSTCENIASLLNINDVQKIQHVLNVIKNFEPIGIASKNLKECLLIQAHYKFNGKSELMKRVISGHLDDIGKKRFNDIAKTLNISIEKVKETAKDIAKLDPWPAIRYRDSETNFYMLPDILLTKDENDNFVIDINKENIPHLKVSSFYQKMLRHDNLSEEESSFIKEKIKNAILFIKSIEQRNKTIRDIANYIVSYQKDFFEQGHEHLKPMTLKDIATSIGRNESTVCRAINSKYMYTPQGLVPLKFFFSQGVGGKGKDEENPVSNRTIKEELLLIVEEEDKTKPLSDVEIQKVLERRNMHVARRTINKYRKVLKILPSTLRRA